MAEIIQQRRGLAATWTSVDPILAQGEDGLETDTNRVKIGDGVSLWSALPYFGELRVVGFALSDETTDLTTGTAKVTFPMPHAMTLTEVRASVNSEPLGADIVVDVNKNGVTVLSTKLSIDDGEKTSATAATPAVISDDSLADWDEITIDLDQIGSGSAGQGLKVFLVGLIK